MTRSKCPANLYRLKCSFIFCTILFVHVETVSVVTIVGGNAIIPCNFSRPESKNDITMVLWYKNNISQPVYTLDNRNGDLTQAKRTSSGELKKRSYFDFFSISQPSLVIDPVKETDDGVYTCRVDFKSSRTFTEDNGLTVIVPPGKPIIRDKFGDVVPEIIGPYDEGKPLVLICETKNGRPSPRLRWWKESELIDDTDRQLASATYRNELVISSLDRSNLNKKLSCTASNNNITVPQETVVKIDMNFRPTKVKILARNALSAKKKSLLKCVSTGSRPPAQITWWKGSKKLTNSKEIVSKNKDMTTSVQSFIPSSDDHGKYLSCRAENPSMSGSAIENGYRLEVFFAPEITLKIGRNKKLHKIREGMELYFECHIRSNPSSHKVRWALNGQQIGGIPSNGIIVNNLTLVVRNITRNHSGVYRCYAENIEGSGQSNQLQIKVKHSPICKPGLRNVYNIAKHESGNVLCEVESFPNEVTFQWWYKYNETSEQIDLTTYYNDETRSVATYVPRTPADYGHIYCSASNKVGKQKIPCTFILNPEGPPDPLHNCTLMNATSDAVDVLCIFGYDGGLESHIVLEIYQDDSHILLANLTSHSEFIRAVNLPPSTDLYLVFYSTNSKGKSNSISILARTLDGMARQTADEESNVALGSPLISILVGIITGTCLVFLLFVVAFKVKTGVRRKGRQAPSEKKYTEELNESNERQSPDILPLNRNCITEFIKDEDYTGGFENVTDTMEKTSLMQKEDTKNEKKYHSEDRQETGVLYAELSLSDTNQGGNEINRKEAPTEYAQLDFVKMKKKNSDSSNSCLAPLMSAGNKRESCV
ncbi:Uncharacterised protein r2_g4104 [Pycnogonum litorale]